MSRRKGIGSLYQQPGCDTWTIQYYRDGKRTREATNTTDKKAAQRKLDDRLRELRSGALIDVQIERISVADLATGLLRDYRVNERKSLSDVESRWRLHLEPFFGHLRAMHVSTNTLNQYVDLRKQQRAENATINRELAALKRALNLGYRSTPRQVQQVPAFPRLRENPPRKGFTTEVEYARLSQNCDEPWLRALLAVAYNFGLRANELLNLRVRHVNLFTKSLTLDPGETKNDEARSIYLTAETYELLKMSVRGKKADDYVFTRGDGTPVRDHRASWYKLCVRSGVGKMRCPKCLVDCGEYANRCSTCKSRLSYRGLLLHDQRRSAVRNMVRRGVPERVGMMVSGHKTRSVFERYNIVSDSDLRTASLKIEQGKALENGHDFSHDSDRMQSTSKPRQVI